MSATVHLGFELGTAKPVAIPLRHMVVTGQTQEAGKTTALEALIARAQVKAVAFITKRGEGSFAGARIIEPYFREQADWQFVASILEASRGEKLKFERAWIIRASKGARTLADVWRNVKKALETAKGLSADVYLTLDAYLEVVVPQIDRVRWAQKVELAPGISAMDLTGLSVELQHLVIRSTLDWVLNREEDTVVVVPEAWKFIPQGRGTPVKLGAEAYIRQAAGLRNYLWLDSQDIAGVEKMILKSVPVWILGVQRESNEVKRTLDQIPAGIKKPKPEQVATLGLGEFYACYGTHVTKVYVQPQWMGQAEAVAIAEGRIDVQSARGTQPRRIQTMASFEERLVDEREAKALRDENQELHAQIADLRRQLSETGRAVGKQGAKKADAQPGGRDVDTTPSPSPVDPRSLSPFDSVTGTDQYYEQIKRRLIAEAPAILKVLVARPELEVEIERVVIHVRGDTLRGRIARLIADDFFAIAHTSAQILDELLRRGANRPSNIELGNELKALCELGFFTRENKWYNLVPDMKVNVVAA